VNHGPDRLPGSFKLDREVGMSIVSPTVFVVDDDVSVLNALSRLLRSAGLTPATFSSAQEFLDQHDPQMPGCLLLDVSMPGFDGLELQQALMAKGITIPIIFLTGNADIPMSVRAMKSGALDFLTKPVNDTDLLDAVNRGIEVDRAGRRAGDEFDVNLDAAHQLGRKLIEVQEKERTRIARELHDGLSQNLALLSINLQKIGMRGGEPGSLKEQVDVLTEQIQRLSLDVHRISHELHPAKLEQLGLEAALRGFCREIAAAFDLKIGFEAVSVSQMLPHDISLCVYRVAQESLQNIAKHSGASIVDVCIKVAGREILLAVTDNGSGFNPAAVRPNESLGLISMGERIHAVKGTLTIDSAVGNGTRITARVPLPAKLGLPPY
jgi:signal transduction histidine kinase